MTEKLTRRDFNKLFAVTGGALSLAACGIIGKQTLTISEEETREAIKLPSGRLIIKEATEEGYTIKSIDLITKETKVLLEPSNFVPKEASVSPDGSFLAVSGNFNGTEQSRIKIYGLQSYEQLQEIIVDKNILGKPNWGYHGRYYLAYEIFEDSDPINKGHESTTKIVDMRDLSSQTLPNVSNFEFNPEDLNLAGFTRKDGQKSTAMIFEFDKLLETPLGDKENSDFRGWSPNGKLFSYVNLGNPERNMMIIDTDTNHKVILNNALDLNWSPNSEHVAFVQYLPNDDRRLTVQNLNTGNRKILSSVQLYDEDILFLSEKWLAVSDHFEGQSSHVVRLFNTETGETVNIPNSNNNQQLLAWSEH